MSIIEPGGWGDPVQAFNERVDERIKGHNSLLGLRRQKNFADKTPIPGGLSNYAREGFLLAAELYGVEVIP